MSDLNNKFTYSGKLYEKNSDGTLDKVITTDNVSTSGIAEVTTSTDGNSITVNTVGLTIDGGLLCATFEESEEV